MLSKDFYTPHLRFATQNIGKVAHSDGGGNPYSKKTYEIFSTPLLRNYRFISSPPDLLLSQYPTNYKPNRRFRLRYFFHIIPQSYA